MADVQQVATTTGDTLVCTCTNRWTRIVAVTARLVLEAGVIGLVRVHSLETHK